MADVSGNSGTGVVNIGGDRFSCRPAAIRRWCGIRRGRALELELELELVLPLCLLNTDPAGSERSRETSLFLGSSAAQPNRDLRHGIERDERTPVVRPGEIRAHDTASHDGAIGTSKLSERVVRRLRATRIDCAVRRHGGRPRPSLWPKDAA